MERKVRMASVAGIFAILCTATAFWAAGCESSNQVVASGASETCPVCERQTRIQPLTGLEYTTCVCPTCGRVTTLDPQFQDEIERFTGLNIGDRVYICDSCGSIIEDCAVCQEKRVARQ